MRMAVDTGHLSYFHGNHVATFALAAIARPLSREPPIDIFHFDKDVPAERAAYLLCPVTGASLLAIGTVDVREPSIGSVRII